MATPIYLDNNSTTRLDPRVLDAMMPYLTEQYGNASSGSHSFGWAAKAAVDLAREQVAQLIGARPDEILFTSGATESNNLAIKGVCERLGSRRGSIVSAPTEHPSVLDVLAKMRQHETRTVFLDVDELGSITHQQLAVAAPGDVALVTLMHANNEIGTIHPLKEVGAWCAEHGVAFHSDATQSAGKIAIDVQEMNINLLSMSAHKLHGPKGVGALYAARGKRRAPLASQMDGGGQERNLRSGTLNVAGIVGLGAAAKLAHEELASQPLRLAAKRDRLLEGIKERIDGWTLNGPIADRLSSNLNIWFHGVDAEAIIVSTPEVAMSTGSACASAAMHNSHVLAALPGPVQRQTESVRMGVSRFTTDEELDRAADALARSIARIRSVS